MIKTYKRAPDFVSFCLYLPLLWDLRPPICLRPSSPGLCLFPRGCLRGKQPVLKQIVVILMGISIFNRVSKECLIEGFSTKVAADRGGEASPP